MAEIVLEIIVDDKGTIKVKQFADESKKAFKEIEEGPKKAQGSLDSLRDSWIGLTAKIGIATAAIYAAKRVTYDFALGIASAANDIERQASILGMNTDEFQRWQYIAKMADVNAQELSISLKMLSRNMEDASSGSGDASKYFAAMGISVKDSAGNLRPLNIVMADIADKFSRWEAGPRKVAIAMQLFGNSGKTIITLLNQGKMGIGALGKEAEKTGAIVRKDLLQAGSEAENIFKGISIQWQSFKLSLGPAALEFAKFLEQIQPGAETIKTIFEEINRTIRDVKRVLEGVGIISPEVEIKRKYIDIKGPKIGPPIIAEGALSKEKIEEDILAFHKLVAEAERLSELGKMPSWEDWAQTIQSPVLRDITQLDLEFSKIIADAQRLSDLGEMPSWEDWANRLPSINKELGERLRIEQAIEKQQSEQFEIMKATGGLPYEVPTEVETMRMNIRSLEKQMTETSKMGETFAQNLASAWNFNIKNIIKDSENMGDAVKNIFLGMADAFTSSISKMISNWILFQDITGTYKAGKGIIGWLGVGISSLLSAGAAGGPAGWVPTVEGLQYGGWIREPIYGIGRSGIRYALGEKEAELVTPKSKVGGGDIYYQYYIDARGAQQGVSKEILRALRETENRAVKRSVNEVADRKMRGGKFSKIFE